MSKKDKDPYGQVSFRFVIKRQDDGSFVIAAPTDRWDNIAVSCVAKADHRLVDMCLTVNNAGQQLNLDVTAEEMRKIARSDKNTHRCHERCQSYLNSSALDDIFIKPREGYTTVGQVEYSVGTYDDLLRLTVTKIFTRSEVRSFLKKAYVDQVKRSTFVANSLRSTHGMLAIVLAELFNNIGAN